MNTLSILLLLAGLTQHAFADFKLTKPEEPDKTVVFIGTRAVHDGRHIIKYTQGRQVRPGTWSQVRKDNVQEGGTSFFKAYRQPYPSDSYLEGTELKKVGGFEKRINVCRGHDYFQGSRTWILTPKSCSEYGQDRWVEEFYFYVASERKPGTALHRYGVCQTKNGGIYGRIVARGSTVSICHGPDVVKEEGNFYTYPGRLFCPLLDAPSNGFQTSSEVRDYGVGAVTFACNIGHQLLGNSVIQCEDNGNWAGQMPTCKAISCGRPSSPNHGSFTGDDFTYRKVVRYSCDEGYQLTTSSPKTRQCLDTGSWSEGEPICERIECNVPNVQNGNVEGGTRFFYGDTISFVCFPRYTLKGAASATCTKDATFSDPIPTCERKRCPNLSHPTNGIMTSSRDFVTESEVIFVCHEGYRLNGEEVVKCEEKGETGVWSAPAPTCGQITCPSPVDPAHGSVLGTDFTYNSAVSFMCDPGFQINGTDRLVCQKDGWDSEPPTCEAISCRTLPVPANGNVMFTTRTYGGNAQFSCNAGYRLDGKSNLFCLETGEWNAHPPRCEPKKCPPLHPLAHGSRDGDSLSYPSTINFTCFPGYELVGSANTSCGEDGTWSNPVPTCRACAIGFYKDSLGPGQCTQCPEHSSTASTASANKEHCQCVSGATRVESGDCKVITCEPLTAPVNGSGRCPGTGYNDQCVFNCDAGFIRQGSHSRKCTADGWTGNPTTCTACPMNTYKEFEGINTCTPCPLNTHTNGLLGTSLQSCVCKPGYRRDSFTCVDIDECAVNNGNCDQRCENLPGRHMCSCTIPGYVLDNDGKTCTLNKTCQSLTDDMPANGFLECKHSDRENSDICHVKCNRGYFFVSGINNYVTCGTDTDFIWSHRVINNTARIPPCTREFFVDTKLPVTVTFKTKDNCNNIELHLTAQQLQQKIQEKVNNLNICRKSCEVQDVSTRCDQSQGNSEVVVTVNFGVLIKNPDENVPLDCDTPCKRLNMRQMLKETFQLKQALEGLFKTQTTSIDYAEARPSLDSQGFSYQKPQILCDPGKVLTSNRLCVPCSAGYYLPDRELRTCLPCPVGTYQTLEGQTSCNPCLEDTTTAGEGSSHPVMCNVVVRKIFRKK
ncbi:sushi, von Willebrand factor type A, EGF and pentraxin domain-containing protein 1 [Lingula anatina]|uniref:Sushi, von Willebrand factor type A, EGF and pentraxin domain-containing protein 1 n=1 Tax=Lingula anatina TaxID=7574 RepID=A0A1S3I611_LINAN|nr:sushi, von Willebrand factor type A, EGF and pentraxin domain-containing protein 1 [Lingula anatina]XP_013393692.1 sushi, von Willebrand factor type A, EGF and pentraxin domain-containing protein 1 [Lingula anatina]|eukprot:XP_013393617.1 sushi, von Willebrand factor type A, EGF and pentraxin domain-containing protein 1 [Lingula anatina]